MSQWLAGKRLPQRIAARITVSLGERSECLHAVLDLAARVVGIVVLLYPPHVARLVINSGTSSCAMLARFGRQSPGMAFERRRSMEVDDQSVWVIAPEDLVLSTAVWAKDSRSELQLRDVRSIIAIQPNLDWSYLDRWALRLTVGSLLQECGQ